jgi:hypothetical protein
MTVRRHLKLLRRLMVDFNWTVRKVSRLIHVNNYCFLMRLLRKRKLCPGLYMGQLTFLTAMIRLEIEVHLILKSLNKNGFSQHLHRFN